MAYKKYMLSMFKLTLNFSKIKMIKVRIYLTLINFFNSLHDLVLCIKSDNFVDLKCILL